MPTQKELLERILQEVTDYKSELKDFMGKQEKVNEMVIRHDTKIEVQEKRIEKHGKKFGFVYTSIFGSGGFIVLSLAMLKYFKII